MQAILTPSNDDILTVANAVNPEHKELIDMAYKARLTVRALEYAVNFLQSAEDVMEAGRMARNELRELERLYVAAVVKGYIEPERRQAV